MIGKELGDFRLLRRLGSGGMAEVYLAEQLSLKRKVAVKILRAETVDESETTMRRRFEQEATAAANLNHANIVQIYAIGEHEGLHFIAQEYVPGTTLRDYVSKKGPLDVLTALRIMRQVALALDAAASSGIVHRDIKPENILLTRKGEAKVADFGLALLTSGEERMALTQAGVTMGTPLYMSPEQVNGGTLDNRSDIYSLGVTGYHMLSGSPPFRGETALAVAVKHLNETPPPLAERRPDLPTAVVQIVDRTMQKRPDRRYQSSKELAADLRKVAIQLKSDPEAADKIRLSKIQPAPRSQSESNGLLGLDQFYHWSLGRHAAMLALAVLIVGGLGAGLGFAMRQPDPFRSPPPQARYEKMPDAKLQFFAAAMDARNPAAWQAVIEYFPRDEFYGRQAKYRLALLSLASNDLSTAESMFDDLKTQNDDKGLKATGLAGQAVVAARRDDWSTFSTLATLAFNIQSESTPIRDELVPYLTAAAQRNRQQIESSTLESLRRLEQQVAEPPE
ncbi:protein kinase domain-containing protein [Stratiformator vulcanicus]|uniref:protein kinase domain-containing protein n=1 Tax=Stratiformator vulcanicus TaxID=2527980 RepID=UPI00287730F6|nr:protein kinase [Stratiformator vulcanicus]